MKQEWHMRVYLNRSRWVNPKNETVQSINNQSHNPVHRLLIKRGLSEENINNFLSPSWDDLYDPYLLKDMDKAVARIEYAIQKQESIWIYGDYDVDGITSVSLLVKCFDILKHPVKYYIPDRHSEGYGLNTEAIDYMKEQGAHVVITVDCGISAVKEAQYSQSIGLDMIITDHHECQEIIPAAIAVINPKQPDCQYPYNMLAGVGLAFKLSMALLGEEWKMHRDDLAELAAFGTIADIAPLADENRIITKKGLEALNNTTNLGFKALIDCSGLGDKTISTGQVGFVLAPKINAAGRIDDPRLGVELLITKSAERAEEIAILLKETNDKRQSLEKGILEEALATVESYSGYLEDKITLVKGMDWNSGVIGIVASRLVEKYKRPAIVFTEIDGIAKGSARSIEGFDIFEGLCQFQDLYLKFGGHEQAAGLSIPIENYEKFEMLLKNYCKETIEDYLLIPSVHIDEDIEISDITHGLLEDLEHMEPHGVGNPKPVFRIKGIRVEKKIAFGKEKQYLKLELAGQMRTFEALSFDTNGLLDPFRSGDMIDIVFNLEMNRFRGMETIQFMIKDLRGERFENQVTSLIEKKQQQSIANQVLQLSGVDLSFPVKPFYVATKPLEKIDNNSLNDHSQKVYTQNVQVITNNQELFQVINREWDTLMPTGIVCWHDIPTEAEHYEHVLLVSPNYKLPGYESYKPDLSVSKITGGIPDRDQMVSLYKRLRSGMTDTEDFNTSDWLCLAVLIDAGLIKMTSEGFVELIDTNGTKIDIMNTSSMLKLHTWQQG